jgi:peroxiredoxin family protein
MMKDKFRRKGVAALEELLDVCRQSSVRLIACALTIDVFGFKESDFIEGVEFGGAGAFMSDARRSHVTLFI